MIVAFSDGAVPIPAFSVAHPLCHDDFHTVVTPHRPVIAGEVHRATLLDLRNGNPNRAAVDARRRTNR